MKIKNVELWARIEANRKGVWEIRDIASSRKELEERLNFVGEFFDVRAKIIKVVVSPKIGKSGRELKD